MNLSVWPRRSAKSLRHVATIVVLGPLVVTVHAQDASKPKPMSGMSMSESHRHEDSTGGMNMDAMMSFGGIPDSRNASGTAWQPDATPMFAHHWMVGDWMTMAHYNLFAGYDHQSGARGDHQFNSINWFMFMAAKRSGENEFTLRGMFSLEPWTTTLKGYPLLFQSGESYQGDPLVDRQHPHDFFMELAARYRRTLTPNTVLSIYAAPSGEPALGPPAFPHRLSAMDNPAAPITHHWVDSTHISFGVLTAGLAQDKWQIEGSWFNGREPDEHRWNIDRVKLDSYSGRFTWNPTDAWSAQVSYGYLKSPEALHPNEHVWRTTASLLNLTKLGDEAHVATTLAWGSNKTDFERSHGVLLESAWARRTWTVFGRAEYVQKSGEELDLPDEHRLWNVRQISLGVSRELTKRKPWQLAIGGAISYTFAPDDLETRYGDHPIGYWIFLRLRPAAMGH